MLEMNWARLVRYPVKPHERLQAWDSADELLIDHVVHSERFAPGTRGVILNDGFGALSAGLRALHPTTYTDSYLSAQAIALNSGGNASVIHDLQELSGNYDWAILKIPKNLSFFEDELHSLRRHLGPESEVVCGAMIKHLSKGAFSCLEKIIGTTHTSLAKKKARLIFAKLERETQVNPYPKSVSLDQHAIPFTHHSNLFSREKLDVGTRFFLEHIPAGEFTTILDLGCGNGIVGIRAKRQNPKAKIIFSDESAMAIASAKANYSSQLSRVLSTDANAPTFHWTHAFQSGETESVDLVLCNPPFHHQQAVGDFIAKDMFLDAYRVLKTGGKMRVIGNSHLHYGSDLKRSFGNAAKIAANSKFVIWGAVKMPDR